MSCGIIGDTKLQPLEGIAARRCVGVADPDRHAEERRFADRDLILKLISVAGGIRCHDREIHLRAGKVPRAPRGREA